MAIPHLGRNPMWSARRATSADLDGLLALCEAAVGADDYVPVFLEEFLRTGVILVAEDALRMLGMVVYHDVPDGSAWLHAARTHPAFRRRGVATDLMKACEALSRRRHRSAMRLWANADNVASVRANTKLGFRERARFTRMRLDLGRGGARVSLEPLRAPDAWRLLADSALVEKGGGYVFHDFYFLPVTSATVRLLAAEKALWCSGGNVFGLSEDFEDPERRGLQIQLVAGSPTDMLRMIPGIARARNARQVESFLPHDAGLLRSAKRAGFALMDWGQEAVLFEKRLRARPGASGTNRPRVPTPSRLRGASAPQAAERTP